MNKIIRKEIFSENVVSLWIEAPMIAKNRKAGHFVMVRPDAKGERIPLTISSSNIEEGTINIIIQKVGVSSAKIAALNVGDYLLDVVGPLGEATHIAKVGTVLAAGGGVGIAPLLPIIEAHHKIGNKVITVLAARNKDLIILEDEVRKFSDEVIVMTDDGSLGKKGLVTQGMEEIILREKINEAVIIGPAVMMKYSAMVTKKHNIPAVASLNTIMVDGTGMCGACRVTVGGKTKFVCVDGPEFNADLIDFDEMLYRLNAYKSEEAQAFERFAEKSK